MYENDFLDELPTTTRKTAAAEEKPADVDADLDVAAIDAASQPASVRQVPSKAAKRVLRRVRKEASPADTSNAAVEKPATTADLADSSDPVREAQPEAASPPQELQTLPEPVSTSRKVPKPSETLATLPEAILDSPPENVNAHWDDFLLSLEKATLVALYELGINAMTEFEEWSLADLMRPRGRLTEAQAREVQDKLLPLGIKLAQKSRVGSLRQGGGQQRIRGLRAPAKNLPALPSDATSAQKRHHRIASNRMTM